MSHLENLAIMISNYHWERESAQTVSNPLGFFRYRIEGPFLYCDAFYVKPEHRNTGAAQDMFQEMLNEGRERDCKTFVAWVDLNSSNPIAVHKALTAQGVKIYDATTNPEYHEYRMDL